jgi:hypothetical protein
MQKRLSTAAVISTVLVGSVFANDEHASSSASMQSEPSVLEHAVRQALLGDTAPFASLGWQASLPRYLAPVSLASLLPAAHGLPAGWAQTSIQRAFSFDWHGDGPIGLRWQQSTDERGFLGRASGHIGGRHSMPGDSGLNVRQNLLAPTVFGRLGQQADFSVSAVFAYQEITPLSVFSAGNPMPEYDRPLDARTGDYIAGDRASGAGARVGIQWHPVDRLVLEASFRSQINMGEYASFRGVYLQPGQIDLPAIASGKATWSATPSIRLSVQAQQVGFSQVDPFVSAQLPIRVLSVLGDLDSPEFAWQDLTVYSMTAEWEFSRGWTTEFAYSSSYQPTPTSALLDRLLSEDSPDDNLRLGLVKSFTDDVRLDFSARYNGDYILGLPIYLQRESDRVNSVEWQAALAWSF